MKRLLALSLILSACTTPQTAPPEQTPVQEPEQKAQPCARGSWCAVWTDTVKQKITPALLNASVSSFCPNAAKFDRKEVWVAIVKSIAWAESGWDPENRYVETAQGIDPITGKRNESVGLLQLSCGDVLSDAYQNLPSAAEFDCRKNPKGITDPITNLKFGMEIMDYLAKKNPTKDISNRLKTTGYSSLGNYWSSVWPEKTTARKKMKALMPGCGL